MRRSDLCKLLDVALHKASNKISLTVTDAPQAETRLRSLLADAIGAGRRNGLPLSEVQLCLDLFPDMLDNFCWAKVTDSADPDVLRLIYEPDLSTGAAA